MAEPDIKSITTSILTASAILQAHDLVIEKIDLPEWGGTAFVREMSGFERDGWEAYAQREIEKKNRAGKYARQIGNIGFMRR